MKGNYYTFYDQSTTLSAMWPKQYFLFLKNITNKLINQSDNLSLYDQTFKK